jgi:hypothetical protein
VRGRGVSHEDLFPALISIPQVLLVEVGRG